MIREVKHAVPWQVSKHFMVFSELPLMDEGCKKSKEIPYTGSSNPLNDRKEEVVW